MSDLDLCIPKKWYSLGGIMYSDPMGPSFAVQYNYDFVLISLQIPLARPSFSCWLAGTSSIVLYAMQ
jgi:hypothetical protein